MRNERRARASLMKYHSEGSRDPQRLNFSASVIGFTGPLQELELLVQFRNHSGGFC